jgi:hypothetical protein
MFVWRIVAEDDIARTLISAVVDYTSCSARIGVTWRVFSLDVRLVDCMKNNYHITSMIVGRTQNTKSFINFRFIGSRAGLHLLPSAANIERCGASSRGGNKLGLSERHML